MEYFRGPAASGDFEKQLRAEEKPVYRCLLGFTWTWVRLLVLRANGFNLEHYHKEMSQFLDESEYEIHQSSQFTVECIDFTFNFMKYAQKVTKKEQIGGLPYPLNYMVHQRLLPVYLDQAEGAKSYLAGNFQDLFFHIQSFSQQTLGVKGAF